MSPISQRYAGYDLNFTPIGRGRPHILEDLLSFLEFRNPHFS